MTAIIESVVGGKRQHRVSGQTFKLMTAESEVKNFYVQAVQTQQAKHMHIWSKLLFHD